MERFMAPAWVVFAFPEVIIGANAWLAFVLVKRKRGRDDSPSTIKVMGVVAANITYLGAAYVAISTVRGQKLHVRPPTGSIVLMLAAFFCLSYFIAQISPPDHRAT